MVAGGAPAQVWNETPCLENLICCCRLNRDSHCRCCCRAKDRPQVTVGVRRQIQFGVHRTSSGDINRQLMIYLTDNVKCGYLWTLYNQSTELMMKIPTDCIADVRHESDNRIWENNGVRPSASKDHHFSTCCRHSLLILSDFIEMNPGTVELLIRVYCALLADAR